MRKRNSSGLGSREVGKGWGEGKICKEKSRRAVVMGGHTKD